ncbi:MAG: beta-propeller fold lactonase family protein [Planctomycetes bacterium]|nr:beta-propeller fold lactonase family protein [Planctomycetota bacterium]
MRFLSKILCIAAPLTLSTAAYCQDEDTSTNIGTFLNFESPQIHPIAVSADGKKLFVVNTPDSRLSIFDTTTASNPVLLSEIPVGMEPVSVRPRTTDELWVVNHASDSISIVSIASGIVTDTINCKDEPCDVVFAGSPVRAYVSVAASREVRVYDVASHALVTTISILGVQPRGLAAAADGLHVYAAVTMSGNKTTIIPASLAPAPPPPTNPNISAAPKTALIVSSTDPAWTGSIPYTVSDNDVAEISTATNTVSRYFTGVGTTNFNVSVRPGTGDLYIPNTDSRNVIRFEPNLRGHAVDNQVSKITITSGAVAKFDLNPGIDYTNPNNPTAKSNALAQPTDVAFTPATGTYMYVASFGTDRVAKMDPATGAILSRIEIGVTPGTTVNSAAKRGPRGLAMHPTAGRLYVLNRITNTVSIINTANDTTGLEFAIGSFDPTPAAIKNGRGFLYDAKLSGNGTMSCASCHIDAESDHEDWDLGDPSGPEIDIPDPSNTYGIIKMHPMKGPMFTQTLRGLSQGSNPLHWRGDRADFNAFNIAFQNLMGGTQLSAANMQAFTDFIMTCDFEPNPNLNLDRSLPATINGGDPNNGKNIFKNSTVPTIGTCNNCHHLPLGTGSKIVNLTVLSQPQGLKVPQLRTSYQKMNFDNTPGATSLSGFGFAHDGTFATMEAFLGNPSTFGAMATDTIAKRDLASFMMCIDTNTPPAAGYSRTAKSTNVTTSSITNDVNMLLSRANAGEIDVIAKGKIDGQLHGLLYVPMFGNFQTDKGGYGPFSWSQLVTKVQAGGTLTMMGVPKGSGQRMGIDHNMNGIPDAEETSSTVLENFGHATPPCAGNIHISSNSDPYIANANFAFTCTGIAPNGLSLLIAASGDGLEPGPDIMGVTLWVDVAAAEVFALDMYADDLGFGWAAIPIPNNPNLVASFYSAMVITLNSCNPAGIAGSQGVRFEIQDAPGGN